MVPERTGPVVLDAQHDAPGLEPADVAHGAAIDVAIAAYGVWIAASTPAASYSSRRAVCVASVDPLPGSAQEL